MKKASLPSKAKRNKDMGMKRTESSTPASQQLSVVKMLETPITPMSLSLPSFGWVAIVTTVQNRAQPAQALDLPQPNLWA